MSGIRWLRRYHPVVTQSCVKKGNRSELQQRRRRLRRRNGLHRGGDFEDFRDRLLGTMPAPLSAFAISIPAHPFTSKLDSSSRQIFLMRAKHALACTPPPLWTRPRLADLRVLGQQWSLGESQKRQKAVKALLSDEHQVQRSNTNPI